MKKLIMVLMLMVGVLSFAHGGGEKALGENVFDQLHTGDKKAVLLVHFGTTVDETREKTIDAVNAKFEKEFKDFEVREAYTSRLIMSRLADRGISKDNPMEALDKLAKEGYTHILIQMTNVINGIETENLRNEVKIYEDKFEVVRVGTPLLTAAGDYAEVANAVASELEVDKDTAVVMVGHGTHHYAEASYGMMDYVFKREGYNNYFIGTVEGYQTSEMVMGILKEQGYKNVVLAPFMLVAGDHAMNDIAGDWKDEFEGNGFNVKAVIRGLGEYKGIQNEYVHKAQHAMVEVHEDIATKKAMIAKGENN